MVKQMLPEPQVLPTLRVAVATGVLPTSRLKVDTESALAVGTMAKASNAMVKIEKFKVFVRTKISSPNTGNEFCSYYSWARQLPLRREEEES